MAAAPVASEPRFPKRLRSLDVHEHVAIGRCCLLSGLPALLAWCLRGSAIGAWHLANRRCWSLVGWNGATEGKRRRRKADGRQAEGRRRKAEGRRRAADGRQVEGRIGHGRTIERGKIIFADELVDVEVGRVGATGRGSGEVETRVKGFGEGDKRKATRNGIDAGHRKVDPGIWMGRGLAGHLVADYIDWKN